MSVLSRVKPIVESVPPIARLFRWVRDWVVFVSSRPRPTGLGFELAGPAGMNTGEFERDIVGTMSRQLESVDCFVDVGANVGYYTCLARSLGRQVIAVEPLPANLRYLRRNLEANGWSDVLVVPSALAARDGEAVLHGAATGASLIEGWGGASQLMRANVRLATLDGLLGPRLGRDNLLIKIDVEGAEVEVLDGAMKTMLATPAPVWVVEIGVGELHPRGMNRFSLTMGKFFDAGYKAFTAGVERREITREDVEAGRRYVDGNGNYLFIKR